VPKTRSFSEMENFLENRDKATLEVEVLTIPFVWMTPKIVQIIMANLLPLQCMSFFITKQHMSLFKIFNLYCASRSWNLRICIFKK
jgi:hypothetical protein